MHKLSFLTPSIIDVSWVKQMHEQYIKNEVMDQLGSRFLHTYYQLLFSDPGTGGLIAYWDDQPVGCCIYSGDVSKVYKKMITRYPFLVGTAMVGYFFRNPKAMFSFKPLASWLFNKNDVQISRYRKFSGTQCHVELLLTVVEKQYRDLTFARKHGIDIARVMVEAVLKSLSKKKITGVYQMVGKHNKTVQMLMRSCGFKVISEFSAANRERIVLVMEIDHAS